LAAIAENGSSSDDSDVEALGVVALETPNASVTVCDPSAETPNASVSELSSLELVEELPDELALVELFELLA
jgi:hypothetical protein